MPQERIEVEPPKGFKEDLARLDREIARFEPFVEASRGVIKALEVANRQLAVCKAALKKVGWSVTIYSDGVLRCPICSHSEKEGHETDCIVGKAMSVLEIEEINE